MNQWQRVVTLFIVLFSVFTAVVGKHMGYMEAIKGIVFACIMTAIIVIGVFWAVGDGDD